VTLRPRRRVVEERQGDAVLRGGIGKRGGCCPVRPGAIDDRRAAGAAEAALIAARALVIFDQVLALEPAEIPGRDPHAAPKRGAVLLAALRAMAVQRSEQGTCDFKCDSAAQAAAVDWGHAGLRCSIGSRHRDYAGVCTIGCPLHLLQSGGKTLRWPKFEWRCAVANEPTSDVAEGKSAPNQSDAKITPSVATDGSDHAGEHDSPRTENGPRQPKHDTFDWINLIILVLTFFAAGGAAYEAKRLADGTDRLIIDGQNSTKEQDKRSREGIEVAQRTMIAGQRAFIFVDTYNWQPADDRSGWGVSLFVENSGNTPVKNLNIDLSCPQGREIVDDPLNTPKLEGPSVHLKRVLGPKQKTTGGTCIFDMAAMQDFQRKGWLLYIVLQAHYEDIFGEKHTTEFCDVIFGLGGNLKTGNSLSSSSTPCRTHNCADEECDKTN
jgi:hypothetical protein